MATRTFLPPRSPHRKQETRGTHRETGQHGGKIENINPRDVKPIVREAKRGDEAPTGAGCWQNARPEQYESSEKGATKKAGKDKRRHRQEERGADNTGEQRAGKEKQQMEGGSEGRGRKTARGAVPKKRCNQNQRYKQSKRPTTQPRPGKAGKRDRTRPRGRHASNERKMTLERAEAEEGGRGKTEGREAQAYNRRRTRRWSGTKPHSERGKGDDGGPTEEPLKEAE